MNALSIGLLVLAVVALTVGYLAWIAARETRLVARNEAAWASLDAQLVRRASAARAWGVELAPAGTGLTDAADTAFALADGDIASPVDHAARETVENALGKALVETASLCDPPIDAGVGAELASAAHRVRLARQFHNDAVRDLRAMRRRPACRLMRRGSADPPPRFFEIDDSFGAG